MPFRSLLITTLAVLRCNCSLVPSPVLFDLSIILTKRCTLLNAMSTSLLLLTYPSFELVRHLLQPSIPSTPPSGSGVRTMDRNVYRRGWEG